MGFRDCRGCGKRIDSKYTYCYSCKENLPFCSNCDNKVFNEDYDECYTCYIKDKNKCKFCCKIVDKKYKICYTCLQKFNLEKNTTIKKEPKINYEECLL